MNWDTEGAGWGSEVLSPCLLPGCFQMLTSAWDLAALQGCLQGDLPLLQGVPHILF